MIQKISELEDSLRQIQKDMQTKATTVHEIKEEKVIDAKPKVSVDNTPRYQ